jgi:hypothetical protein
MSIRACLFSLAVLLAATPVFAAGQDYNGPDGGWLVFSITTGTRNPDGTDVIVNFRPVGGGSAHTEESQPQGMFHSNADATAATFDPQTQAIVSGAALSLMNGPTKTDVYAVRLPPGRYEVFYVQVSGAQGTVHYASHFTSHPIGFAINAGRTTYLGSITPAPISIPGLFGLPRFVRWVRILTDQSERDLAIAAAHGATLGPVDRPPPPPGWGTGLSAGAAEGAAP